MTIEKLAVSDLPAYRALMDECFGNSSVEGCKECDAYDIVVAKEGGALLGSMTLYKIELFTFGFQPCLELFNVAVTACARGRGIGHALMDYAKEYAKEHGYKSISLTCLEEAAPAHRLYEAAGFKRAPSRKYALYL
ncbi:MAG TPA: GNAT family N-acetyltransferase [Terriglobales bacterium]|nr:GNAT family N-acetyltransferase [Terriglobales bacterium]